MTENSCSPSLTSVTDKPNLAVQFQIMKIKFQLIKI
jgi:hypothetical protein